MLKNKGSKEFLTVMVFQIEFQPIRIKQKAARTVMNVTALRLLAY